jgi:selenoprotein W-related protein
MILPIGRRLWSGERGTEFNKKVDSTIRICYLFLIYITVMGELMKIVIEYCVVWNYLPRAAGLADELKRIFGAEVALKKSTGGVFEVTVNEMLVFSKKQLSRFPDPGEVKTLIQKAIKWFKNIAFNSLDIPERFGYIYSNNGFITRPSD